MDKYKQMVYFGLINRDFDTVIKFFQLLLFFILFEQVVDLFKTKRFSYKSHMLQNTLLN